MKPVYSVKMLERPDWDAVPVVELKHTGWLEACPIEAKAQVCCDGENLWVRMEAVEAPIRATLTGKLDAVCTDSCLEFFLAPWSEDARYWAENALREGIADTEEEADQYTYVHKEKIPGKAVFTYFRKFRILEHGGWYE